MAPPPARRSQQAQWEESDQRRALPEILGVPPVEGAGVPPGVLRGAVPLRADGPAAAEPGGATRGPGRFRTALRDAVEEDKARRLSRHTCAPPRGVGT